MNSLRIIGRKLAPSRRVKVRVAPKVADGVLHSPQHRAFRLIVCRRAGWRCEWVEDGPLHEVCSERAPRDCRSHRRARRWWRAF